MRDKVRRRCPQATTFLKSSKGGPKRKPVCHAVYVYTRQLKPRVVQKPVCRAVYVYTRQLKPRVVQKPVCRAVYVYTRQLKPRAVLEASVSCCLRVYQTVEAASPYRKKPVCHAVYVYTRQSKQRVHTERSQCVMLSTCIPDSWSSEAASRTEASVSCCLHVYQTVEAASCTEASVSCCLHVYQTVEEASPFRKKPMCYAVYVYTRQLKKRVRPERSQCVMLSTCIPDSRSSELYRSQCVMLSTCILDSWRSESVQKEASVSCCLRVYQTVEAASPHRKKPACRPRGTVSRHPRARQCGPGGSAPAEAPRQSQASPRRCACNTGSASSLPSHATIASNCVSMDDVVLMA